MIDSGTPKTKPEEIDSYSEDDLDSTDMGQSQREVPTEPSQLETMPNATVDTEDEETELTVLKTQIGLYGIESPHGSERNQNDDTDKHDTQNSSGNTHSSDIELLNDEKSRQQADENRKNIAGNLQQEADEFVGRSNNPNNVITETLRYIINKAA